MEKRLMTFVACLFLSIGMALAQSQISGTVTSAEDGTPVVGASVKVVGTSTGVATDTDGHFTLNAPANAKLQISYIGMVPQTVKAGKNLKISLATDQQSLDELVVVAFGTAKKSAFTGSATVVGTEELAKSQVTSVTNALAGAVPGVQLTSASGAPGSTSTIRIRGFSSLNAGNDALIILDGAPYSGDLSNINPNDVESMTVLKDAASNALYGARGANGVIMITTKKSKAGRDAKVTLDAKYGWNSRALQHYDVINDPAEYYEMQYKALYNNYVSNGASASSAWASANSALTGDVSTGGLGYNIWTVPEGQMLIGQNGRMNPNATLGRVVNYKGQDYLITPDDWEDEATRTGIRQEYNVSVNGANEKSNFYASFGYLKNEGITYKSDLTRITGRLRADYQAKKWLKLGVNAQYMHSDQNSSPNLSENMSSANIMYYTQMIGPIYPVYVRKVDSNGNVYIATDSYGHKKYDYGVYGTDYGPTRAFLATGNPLGSNQYNKDKYATNQLNANITADVSFTEWLKLNITSSVTYNTIGHTDYQNSYEGPSAGANGKLTKSEASYLRTNNTQTLTFMKSFGKHNVDALIGHEYYRNNNQYLASMAMSEYSPKIQEIDTYANRYNGSSYTKMYNVEGYFARAQYNYDGKYFGSASYRRDASSRFAKKNRWGDFWSVGGAWLINKEKWFNASFVDQLKLKASIGQQGNDGIGAYAYTNLYTLTATSTTLISPMLYRYGNEDITWETTTNFNVGLEFSLFKSRLVGTLDFYSKKTTDLLFWVSIPESNAARGYYTNLGDIRNSGVELTLTGAIIRNKDIDWTVTANFSHNDTKILKLPASKTEAYGGFSEAASNGILSYWYREGGPLYNAFMPKYAGVSEDGEAMYWVDDELSEVNSGTRPGKNLSSKTTDYSKATYYEQGSMLPKLFGGFSTSFRYKSFDASVTFDYQLGGKVYDNAYRTMMACMTSSRGHAIHKDLLNAWTSENPSTTVPRMMYGDSYTTSSSDRWLTSARYLNFQSFAVGYTLPKNLIPQVSKIRIYCMGENLCFWSARKGLDPRYAYDGSGYTGTYSPTRNISGGIQVTF